MIVKGYLLRIVNSTFSVLTMLVVLLLTGCADRPSFVSIKNTMEELQRAERIPGIVDVEGMYKLDTEKTHDEFVVLLVYKLKFLLSLDEAIDLMDESIRQSMPRQADIPPQLASTSSDVIRQGLIAKYGQFRQNDQVDKRVELLYRKKGDQWAFVEMRKPPMKIDYSLFPQD